MQRLEALGAEVLVAAADVCNLEEMRAAVAAATERFGGVDAVIHAAGVIDDGPLLAKTQGAIEDVLSPKVHGTKVLDALFPDGSLDWLALFSSTSTVTAPAGQVDYVAANEFLNAYAKSRRGGRTRVVAIDWGIWNEVGMAATALAERLGDTPKAAARAGRAAAARRRELRRRRPPALRVGAIRRPATGCSTSTAPGGRRAAAGHRLPRARRRGAAGARRDRRLRDPRPLLPAAADGRGRPPARRQGAPRPLRRGLPLRGAQRRAASTAATPSS